MNSTSNSDKTKPNPKTLSSSTTSISNSTTTLKPGNSEISTDSNGLKSKSSVVLTKEEYNKQVLYVESKFKELIPVQMSKIMLNDYDKNEAIIVLLNRITKGELEKRLPSKQEIDILKGNCEGISDEQAIKALIVRDELKRLRKDGLDSIAAVEMLISRVQNDKNDLTPSKVDAILSTVFKKPARKRGINHSEAIAQKMMLFNLSDKVASGSPAVKSLLAKGLRTKSSKRKIREDETLSLPDDHSLGKRRRRTKNREINNSLTEGDGDTGEEVDAAENELNETDNQAADSEPEGVLTRKRSASNSQTNPEQASPAKRRKKKEPTTAA